MGVYDVCVCVCVRVCACVCVIAQQPATTWTLFWPIRDTLGENAFLLKLLRVANRVLNPERRY